MSEKECCVADKRYEEAFESRGEAFWTRSVDVYGGWSA